MKYYKRLIGKKCYLSPVNLDDIPKFIEYLSDIELNINDPLFYDVLTHRKEEDFFNMIHNSGWIFFVIIDSKTDQLIGTVHLMPPDYVNRTSELGINILDKSYWNKGYGSEAINLILDYGFNALNLHSVMLKVYSFNKHAIRCYEKCGFKNAGVLREQRIIGRKVYDIVMMDILANEYKSLYLADEVARLTKDD